MTQSQFIQRLKHQPQLGFPTVDPLLTAAVKLTAALTAVNYEFDTMYSRVQEIQDLEGMNKQVGQNEKLLEGLKKAIKATTVFEERNKKLNIAFGVGSKAAGLYSEEFAKMAKEQGVGLDNMKNYAISVKKVVPFLKGVVGENKKYYTGLTRVQQLVTTNLQLSEEQANKFTGFAAQTGKLTDEVMYNSAQFVEQIEKSRKMTIPFKDVVAEIAASGEATQLQFGRIPGRIELAAIKAKSLGLSLDELSKSGTQMLDIESSIGKELEYQLLSGNRLVNQQGESLTNKFREATLQGDASKQADTLNSILEQEGKVLENNMIARQKMADLLGMDENTLARTIQKRKILEQTGATELFNLSGDELTDAANTLVKEGKMKADDFEKLVKNEDTRTTNQKMDEQIDLLSMIASATFFTSQQSTGIAKSQEQVGKIFENLKSGGAASMLQMSDAEIRKVGSAELKTDRKLLIEKGGTGTLGQADEDAAVPAEVTDTSDLFFAPGIGTQTGGYGELFNLDGRDGVLAGPPDALQSMVNGTKSSTLHIDYTAMGNAFVAALQGAKFEVADNRALDNYYSALT